MKTLNEIIDLENYDNAMAKWLTLLSEVAKARRRVEEIENDLMKEAFKIYYAGAFDMDELRGILIDVISAIEGEEYFGVSLYKEIDHNGEYFWQKVNIVYYAVVNKKSFADGVPAEELVENGLGFIYGDSYITNGEELNVLDVPERSSTKPAQLKWNRVIKRQKNFAYAKDFLEKLIFYKYQTGLKQIEPSEYERLMAEFISEINTNLALARRSAVSEDK